MADFTKLNGYDVKDSYARNEIAQMKINFQNGVDTIYNAIVAQGVTPSASTPSACANGISQVATNKYNSGKHDAYNTVSNPVSASNGTVGMRVTTITLSVTANRLYIISLAASLPQQYFANATMTGGTIVGKHYYRYSDSLSVEILVFKSTSNSITINNIGYYTTVKPFILHNVCPIN